MATKAKPPASPAGLTHFILSDSDLGWQAEFDIDMATAPVACRESLDFFGDPIMREDDSPEELVTAFLKFWGPMLIAQSITQGRDDGQPGDMIKAMGRFEGIVVLDGSHGITLTYCDRLSFDPYQFEVASGKGPS